MFLSYRPLSTTGTRPHKQKRKPQMVKAVQPQEVNYIVWAVMTMAALCVSLTLLSWLPILSTQQCFAIPHSEVSPLPFIKCKRESLKCRAALLGFMKCKQNKENKKRHSRCLSVPVSLSLPLSFSHTHTPSCSDSRLFLCKLTNRSKNMYVCMIIHVIFITQMSYSCPVNLKILAEVG